MVFNVRQATLLNLSAAVLLALLTCSCSKQQDVESREIGVLTPRSGAGATKGSGGLTTESLRSRSFGLFGYYRDGGDYFEGVDEDYLLVDNATMSYVETTGGGDRWVCDPTVYWPLGCSMTFFAYAPHLDADGAILTLPNADGHSMLRGTFNVPADPKEQPDFCLSDPVMDWTVSQGDVPVSFEHALTRVRFYFNLKGLAYEGDYHVYRVKELSIEGLVGTNKFTYGGTNGWYWDDLPRNASSLRTASYSMSIEDGTLDAVDLPYSWDRISQSGLDRFECINLSDDAALYLLPQPLTSAASVSLQLAAYMDDGEGNWVEDTRAEIAPMVVSLPEATVWRSADTVCYSASIDMTWDMEMVFAVTVTPWEVEEKDVTIPAVRP